MRSSDEKIRNYFGVYPTLIDDVFIFVLTPDNDCYPVVVLFHYDAREVAE